MVVGMWVGSLLAGNDRSISKDEMFRLYVLWSAAGAIVFAIFGVVLAEKIQNIVRERESTYANNLNDEEDSASLSTVETLERLAQLKASGALTEEEFATEKKDFAQLRYVTGAGFDEFSLPASLKPAPTKDSSDSHVVECPPEPFSEAWHV